jgi:hypothetical protein
MIVTRLKLPLEQAEYTALLEAAEKELRNPADQARFILRPELERRGLLPADRVIAPITDDSKPVEGGMHVTDR